MRSENYEAVIFLLQLGYWGGGGIGKSFPFDFLKFSWQFCAEFLTVSETCLLHGGLRGVTFQFSWHTEAMLTCSI